MGTAVNVDLHVLAKNLAVEVSIHRELEVGFSPFLLFSFINDSFYYTILFIFIEFTLFQASR